MDAVCLESLESLNQILARAIEVLEDGLQAFRRNGFYSHQRASDVRLPHGIEKLRIFGCLHGDLGVENRVGGQLSQLAINSNLSSRIARSSFNFC